MTLTTFSIVALVIYVILFIMYDAKLRSKYGSKYDFSCWGFFTTANLIAYSFSGNIWSLVVGLLCLPFAVHHGFKLYRGEE